MQFRTWRAMRTAVIPLAVAGALVVACSDEAEGPSEPVVATVTAVDYAFEGLPDTVKVGSQFQLKNTSSAELHELVAIAYPAGEERSVEELLKLPQEELEALFAGLPAMVLIAPPNADGIAVVGDGTFSAPGRYAIICAIPTGANPDAYMAAAQASGNEPPQVEGGPPHFVQGMYGEVTVVE